MEQIAEFKATSVYAQLVQLTERRVAVSFVVEAPTPPLLHNRSLDSDTVNEMVDWQRANAVAEEGHIHTVELPGGARVNSDAIFHTFGLPK